MEAQNLILRCMVFGELGSVISAALGSKVTPQPKPAIYPDNQSGAAASPKKTFVLLKACLINHCSVEYVGNTHFVQSQE